MVITPVTRMRARIACVGRQEGAHVSASDIDKKRRFQPHLSVAKNAVIHECGREDLNLHPRN